MNYNTGDSSAQGLFKEPKRAASEETNLAVIGIQLLLAALLVLPFFV